MTNEELHKLYFAYVQGDPTQKEAVANNIVATAAELDFEELNKVLDLVRNGRHDN